MAAEGAIDQAAAAADLKKVGIALYQSKDFSGAAAAWTAALGVLDSQQNTNTSTLRTSLLLNLSLVAFLVEDFAESSRRASEVIDNFDSEQTDIKDLAKAYARRGAVRRRSSEFYKAYDDILSAMLLAPKVPKPDHCNALLTPTPTTVGRRGRQGTSRGPRGERVRACVSAPESHRARERTS